MHEYCKRGTSRHAFNKIKIYVGLWIATQEVSIFHPKKRQSLLQRMKIEKVICCLLNSPSASVHGYHMSAHLGSVKMFRCYFDSDSMWIRSS